MEVYEIIKSIGSGSFGQVYLARHKREDKNYVIKKIKIRDMPQKDRENTEQEVGLLKKLRHTNIVAYKDSFLDREQYLNIVMVYCEGGDMYNKIRNQKGKNFNETQILDWFAQMALALYYLHDQKILHRDLKTQNIFLKHGRVRLGDFGIAKVLDSTREFANTCIGTPYYMSPELFKYKPYSYKSDVWALGCCIYEICTLRHAFDAQTLNGLAVKILKGSYPPVNSMYSKPLRDLINKMISINPKQRPTIWDILNKSFIKKRVIEYLTEIFSGNYPEASLPNDVDDIYIDSLKEQAERMGIIVNIKEKVALNNHNNNNINLNKNDEEENFAKKPNVHQKKIKENKTDSKVIELEKQKKKQQTELRKIVDEKQNLEEEINKLEKKKIIKGKKNKINKQNNNNKEPKDANKDLKQESKEIMKERSSKESFKEQKDNKQSNKIQKNIMESNSQEELPKEKKFKITAKTKSEVSKLLQDKSSQEKQQDKLKDKDTKPEENLNIESKNTKKSLPETESESHNINPRKLSLENQDPFDNPAQLKDKARGFLDQKERVLFEKERKRKEEQVRWEEQFRVISMENYQARKIAVEKKNAQYRPSHDMKGLISNAANVEAQKNEIFEEEKVFKIQEDYEMDEESNDDDEIIIEEENEEDEGMIEKKINSFKHKITEKTARISELKESLKKTMQILEKSFVPIKNEEIKIEDPVEEAMSISTDELLLEESEDEDYNNDGSPQNVMKDNQNQPTLNPQEEKIKERIKLLKHRCEAGIGNTIYNKAYSYVKENVEKAKNDELRKNLIEILGEDNIGFWHLIDQIVFYENLLPQFHSKNI